MSTLFGSKTYQGAQKGAQSFGLRDALAIVGAVVLVLIAAGVLQ